MQCQIGTCVVVDVKHEHIVFCLTTIENGAVVMNGDMELHHSVNNEDIKLHKLYIGIS